MIRLFASREFLAFLLTGGIAAVVNFGSRILYSCWVPFPVAVMVAYISGMITAYVLARLFVFRESKQAFHRTVLWFVLVNLAAVAQTLGVSLALDFWILPALQVLRWREEIAHAVGVAVPVFSSYLGHKYLTFR